MFNILNKTIALGLNIRERDGNRCQHTGRLLHPDEGSLDHVVPRSRGGADT